MASQSLKDGARVEARALTDPDKIDVHPQNVAGLGKFWVEVQRLDL